MKRILIVLPNLDLGGMETVVMNYFRAIDREKIIFDFVVHGEKGFFEDEAVSLGAKIFRCPTRKKNFFKNIFTMRKIYKKNLNAPEISDDAYFFGAREKNFEGVEKIPREKISREKIPAENFVAGAREKIPHEKYETVIVCTEHAFAFIELFVAWICGVKIRAAWSHFSDYQGRSKLKRRLHFFARPFLCAFTNLFLACTEDAGRWLFGGLHKKNFCIINNAIDLEKFKFDETARKKIRSEYNLGESFTIGIVGRLVPVKNHAFAKKIFAELRKEKNFDAYENIFSSEEKRDAVLMIIGDGELRCELDSRDEKIIFTGAVENIREFYSALDFLIVPSFHEGFPMIAVEAQASGLPVLLSENITRGVALSPLANFKSLDAGAKNWAREILKTKIPPREKINLSASGFDIKTEGRRFECLMTKGGCSEK